MSAPSVRIRRWCIDCQRWVGRTGVPWCDGCGEAGEAVQVFPHRFDGYDGIRQVVPNSGHAIVCGDCGRAWVEDRTSAGRCPWEHEHIEPATEERPDSEESDVPVSLQLARWYSSDCDDLSCRSCCEKLWDLIGEVRKLEEREA